jgi:hypothetical protein
MVASDLLMVSQELWRRGNSATNFFIMFSPHHIFYLMQYTFSSPSRIHHDTQQFVQRRGERGAMANLVAGEERNGG